MLEIGHVVRVKDGEHHGKIGTVVAVSAHHTDEGMRVVPVLEFGDGTRAEIAGPLLEHVRRRP